MSSISSHPKSPPPSSISLPTEGIVNHDPKLFLLSGHVSKEEQVHATKKIFGTLEYSSLNEEQRKAYDQLNTQHMTVTEFKRVKNAILSSVGLKMLLTTNAILVTAQNREQLLKHGAVLVSCAETFGEARTEHGYIIIITELSSNTNSTGFVASWVKCELNSYNYPHDPLGREHQNREYGEQLFLRSAPSNGARSVGFLQERCEATNVSHSVFDNFYVLSGVTAADMLKSYQKVQDNFMEQAQKSGKPPAYGENGYNCNNAVYDMVVAALSCRDQRLLSKL